MNAREQSDEFRRNKSTGVSFRRGAIYVPKPMILRGASSSSSDAGVRRTVHSMGKDFVLELFVI